MNKATKTSRQIQVNCVQARLNVKSQAAFEHINETALVLEAPSQRVLFLVGSFGRAKEPTIYNFIKLNP